MKVKSEQLKQSLNKPQSGLIIISGDEPLLVDELRQQTLQAFKQLGIEDITRFNVTAGFDWGQFIQTTQTGSLFAEKTAVLVHLTNWKLDTLAKESLARFAEHPSAHHRVIVTGPKVEASTLNTKWFKAIEKYSLFCAVWPIEGKQLPQWIQRKGKELELTLTMQQARYIAAYTEGNLLATQQELEKLRLLDTPITDELLETCISYGAEHNSFKLIDHCLAGHHKQASNILLSLQQQGIEPILILWAINKEIQLLQQLTHKLGRGDNLRTAAKQLRVWEKKIALYQAYITRHDAAACQHHLRQLANIDKGIKGLSTEDVWRSLHVVCMQITGVQLPASMALPA